MQPLKILYSSAGSSYDEGARYIHHLMQAMRAQGHRVEGLCRADSVLAAKLRSEKFTVHELPLGQGLAAIAQVFALRKLLKQQSYDVVNSNGHEDTLRVGLAARLARVPLVVRTYHQAKAVSSALANTKIPHRTIAVNQFIGKQLLSRRIKASHLAIIYEAVVVPTQETSIDLDLRKVLNLEEKSFLIGTAAELRKGSGAQELIQAMAPLLGEQTQLHVVIFGTGELQSQLEAFATQLGVKAQVHFMEEEINLNHLDLFVFGPYEADTAMIVAQAAAVKLPVVGTKVGAIPEMIAQGKSGMLVPLHDVVALRKALERLVTNTELAQQMGQAGYAYIMETDRFLLTTMQQQTEKAYRSWLEQLR